MHIGVNNPLSNSHIPEPSVLTHADVTTGHDLTLFYLQGLERPAPANDSSEY